jgi:hypothetical protein
MSPLKGRTTMPLCVSCLFAIGWGIKRVCRHTGYAKTTVQRYAKARGLISVDQGKKKRQMFAAMERSRALEIVRAAANAAAEKKREREMMRPIIAEMARRRNIEKARQRYWNRPEYFRRYSSDHFKKQSEGLHFIYVRRLLVAKTMLRVSDIPQELVELKRIQLTIDRSLKHENRK